MPVREERRRRPGSAKGKIHLSKDFDASLPAAILNGFAGGSTD